MLLALASVVSLFLIQSLSWAHFLGAFTVKPVWSAQWLASDGRWSC